MLARSHSINARVSALEAYVGMPEEPTGMTITARLEAQHSLLLAIRDDHNDLRAQMRETNRRLTALEDAMGKVLWGITEIKKRLPGDLP